MSLLPLSQRTVCKADPINDTVVLGERKTFGVRRDMLTVTADDGRGGGAGHQAGAGFEHRIGYGWLTRRPREARGALGGG
jgi:hypothetical protein